MKTIRAFVRCDCIDEVLEAVSAEETLHLTVSHVYAAGPGIDEADGKISVDFGRKVNRVGRIEILCLDRNEPKITEAIRRTACTGHPGDGVIVVSNVTRLVEIRERRESPRPDG